MALIKDIHTFLINDEGEKYYLSSPRYGGDCPFLETEFIDAHEVDVNNIERTVDVYTRLCQHFGKDNVQLIRLQVDVSEEVLDIMNEGEYLEQRRRAALEKLSDDDIEALGLQKLATYNKLKFHRDSKSGDLEDSGFF